jgi:hypothetical protein
MMRCSRVHLASTALVVGLLVDGGLRADSDALTHPFSGCITYQIEFESLDPQASLAKLQAQFGNSVIRCYGKLGYRVDYQGQAGTLWYLSLRNREYQLEKGAQVLSVSDCSTPLLRVEKTSAEASTLSILGHELKLFTMHFVDGSVDRFWFAPDLPMDTAPYAAHRFAGTDRYFLAARAAFLKEEWRSTRGYIRRDIALSIQPGEPPAQVFELPKLPEEQWPP